MLVHLSYAFRHMDVHVCTDDIGSLQSTTQIFIGRDIRGKDRSTVLISDYCLCIEYFGRMFWGHIKLL